MCTPFLNPRPLSAIDDDAIDPSKSRNVNSLNSRAAVTFMTLAESKDFNKETEFETEILKDTRYMSEVLHKHFPKLISILCQSL